MKCIIKNRINKPIEEQHGFCNSTPASSAKTTPCLLECEGKLRKQRQ